MKRTESTAEGAVVEPNGGLDYDDIGDTERYPEGSTLWFLTDSQRPGALSDVPL